MYIIIMYDVCTPGCRAARLIHENPAVRVEAAWNKPSKTR
jgi:hypothetical protein